MCENHVIGIDLGGTHIKCALFDPATDRLLAQETMPTRDGELHGNVPQFARSIAGQIATWQAEHKSRCTVGIGAPGLAARDGRSIAYMPGRLKGLQDLDWPKLLGQSCMVLNDAQAAMLGEIWQGAAQGLQNVFMLTLGTGVGGAAIVDGRLLRGHLGRAGHLGHISLDVNGPYDIVQTPGSLELAIGDCTVSQRSNGQFASTEALVVAVRQGHASAQRVWQKSIHALACGITSLINVLDPEAVILAGGIVQAGDILLQPLRQALDRVEWQPANHSVRLQAAQLHDWAGAYGAAYAALHPEVTL